MGAGGSQGTKNVFRAGVLYWAGVKQLGNKSLPKVIDKEGGYNFRPYTYTLWGIHKVQLFEKDSKKISLVLHEAIPMKAQALLGIVAPSMLLSKLEPGERTVIYNPPKGDVATCMLGHGPRGAGHFKCFDHKNRIYRPKEASYSSWDGEILLAWVGLRWGELPRGALYWQKCVRLMNEFVRSKMRMSRGPFT